MTPKFIGSGAEGEVYRISKDLIMKKWGNYREAGLIVPDLKAVQAIHSKLPPFLKGLCRVPEFAGWEIVRGKVVTYHQYIKPEPISSWHLSRLEYLDDQLNKHFSDVQLTYGFTMSRKKLGTNCLFSKGKLWLVDVMPGGGDD